MLRVATFASQAAKSRGMWLVQSGTVWELWVQRQASTGGRRGPSQAEQYQPLQTGQRTTTEQAPTLAPPRLSQGLRTPRHTVAAS